jgi:hypothetical protein
LRFWNILQPDAGFPIAFHKRLHTPLEQDSAPNIKAEVWTAEHWPKQKHLA